MWLDEMLEDADSLSSGRTVPVLSWYGMEIHPIGMKHESEHWYYVELVPGKDNPVVVWHVNEVDNHNEVIGRETKQVAAFDVADAHYRNL
jgi:hypothetical protein